MKWDFSVSDTYTYIYILIQYSLLLQVRTYIKREMFLAYSLISFNIEKGGEHDDSAFSHFVYID